MSTYNIKWLNNIPKFNPPKLSTKNNIPKSGGHFKWRSVKQKKKNKKRTFRKYLKKFR